MFKRKKKVRDLLVFLDVDGVLNTTNSRITKYEIRDENVNALGSLKEKSEKRGYSVKMVLSSTWRIGYDENFDRCSRQVQKLITKLKQAGITIYAKTPVYKDKPRDVEISRYIKGYRIEHERHDFENMIMDADFDYIILDDDTSIFDEEALKQMTFYKVNEHTGLTAKDVGRILKIL